MRLAEYLAEETLKPAEFARRINVQPSTISRLLDGRRGASLNLAIKIRDATGGCVSLDEIAPERPGRTLTLEDTGATS